MSHYETAYQLIWQKAIELYENGKTTQVSDLEFKPFEHTL